MAEGFPVKNTEAHHGSKEEKPLAEEILDLLNLSLEEIRERIPELAERVAELRRKSRADELTGLLNRNGFREEVQQFEAVFARERRAKNVEIPTALLAIDLDGFKEVNDTGGHSCGDRCLQLIAEHVKSTLRESDLFARVGGDEFSIFLSESNEEGALEVARKVRSVLEGVVTDTIRLEFPSYKGKLSASIGIVISDSDQIVTGKDRTGAIDEAMKQADYAAYVVKAAGKQGELTLDGAKEVDADGNFQRDFLQGKTLPR